MTSVQPSGIAGYGVYVPYLRIKLGEIARVWGKDGERSVKGLGVTEKAVGSIDEDSATFAVEAARRAFDHCKLDPARVEAVYVGSESKPYAVKPTASIVAEALGSTPHLTAADMEFACKAGTAGIQACMGQCKSGMIDLGLAIGSDAAQGRPNDALEMTAGSGAAAYVITPKKEEMIAEIELTYSYTTDTPDFWRRQHAEFPSHAGRFTAEPAYFRHITECAKEIMKRTNTKPEDFDYYVPHQPNGKFPVRIAKALGFSDAQVKPALTTPYIGNTYSGSALIGLSAVLDIAKPGARILMTSYGSGAGSDGFVMTTTDVIETKRPPKARQFFEMIKNKEYVDYAVYAKNRRKIKSM